MAPVWPSSPKAQLVFQFIISSIKTTSPKFVGCKVLMALHSVEDCQSFLQMQGMRRHWEC